MHDGATTRTKSKSPASPSTSWNGSIFGSDEDFRASANTRKPRDCTQPTNMPRMSRSADTNGQCVRAAYWKRQQNKPRCRSVREVLTIVVSAGATLELSPLVSSKIEPAQIQAPPLVRCPTSRPNVDSSPHEPHCSRGKPPHLYWLGTQGSASSRLKSPIRGERPATLWHVPITSHLQVEPTKAMASDCWRSAGG